MMAKPPLAVVFPPHTRVVGHLSRQFCMEREEEEDAACGQRHLHAKKSSSKQQWPCFFYVVQENGWTDGEEGASFVVAIFLPERHKKIMLVRIFHRSRWKASFIVHVHTWWIDTWPRGHN